MSGRLENWIKSNLNWKENHSYINEKVLETGQSSQLHTLISTKPTCKNTCYKMLIFVIKGHMKKSVLRFQSCLWYRTICRYWTVLRGFLRRSQPHVICCKLCALREDYTFNDSINRCMSRTFRFFAYFPIKL